MNTGWAHPRSRGENPTIVACRLPAAGSSPLTRGKPHARRSPRHRRGLIPAHAGKTIHPRAPPPHARAHPRSRGENSSEAGDEKGSTGSSPLTRGKHGWRTSSTPRLGLIPAHAGKTPAPSPAGTGGGAHPRSRGENFVAGMYRFSMMGSSPLTRGKRGWRERPLG